MTARRHVRVCLACGLFVLLASAFAARAAEAAAEHAQARAAAAAPSPISDPMERLRQRLAERLAGGSSDNLSGKVELRAGDAAAAAAAAASEPGKRAAKVRAGAPAGVRAQAADAARGSMAPNAVAHRSGAPVAQRAAADKPSVVGALHPEIPHWGYEGAGGPNAWGSLRSEFAQCAAGQRQSPIDIRDGLAVDLDPVRFDYQPSRFSVVDNGHTVQANIAPGNAIEVGSRRYELVQLHFHRPSEERIDGRQFEMSVHLVHKDAQGRLVVVAVLLEKGPAQPVVQSVWNNLPLEKKEEVAARAMLDPAGLLPADRRYYTYMGSLTTPPCSEGVQWVVMRAPMTAAAEQIELFTRIYPMNARPLQSAAGRRILQSN